MRVFVHAFHKSGSMFLHRYFGALADHAGAAYFSVNNEPRNEQGWKDCPGDFVVCPIRAVATGMSVDRTATNVFHLRNPVDVLISSYYWVGWGFVSAATEAFMERRSAVRSMTIDAYCIEASDELSEKYRAVMAEFDSFAQPICSDYSLMHGNFRAWNAAMCRIFPDASRAEAEKKLHNAFKNEFATLPRLLRRPWWRIGSAPHRRDGRDNQQHRHLRPETIARLEHDMRDVLAFYKEFQVRSRSALPARP